MSQIPSEKTLEFDLVVIGGGLVGLTVAIGAGKLGLNVAVIERTTEKNVTKPAFDGRACALAFATTEMLDALGIWQYMEKESGPINEIRVSDGPIGRPSPFFLHFDHKSLGDGPLGHMVENRHIRIALFKAMKGMKTVQLFAPDEVASVERDKLSAAVTLKSGAILKTRLVVAADGKRSITRQNAGISQTEWGYDQVGIVCAIEHELSHDGIAHERFLPSGPFAILPLKGNRSSLVWTEKTHLEKAIMGLSDKGFESEVSRRVGDFLGKVKVKGGRWSYPLSLSFADRYTDTRLALVGDAAHAIHPIAGQGLNMGLRDVAALLETIKDRIDLGLDIGSSDALDAYASWRHFDNATLMGVTDALNRLFSNHSRALGHVRDLGLAAVNQIPPLKNFFMSHARGTVGHLPRLLKGQAIERSDS